MGVFDLEPRPAAVGERPSNFNLRQLECFFAVAETLHFGQAAAKLHVGQPSVSEALQALERALGQPLLERSTRHVQLTPFGQDFLNRTKPAYDALLSAYHTTKRSSVDRAALRIGHTPELGDAIFPSLVHHLERECKESPLRIKWAPSVMDTPAQVTAVAEGRIDVGLCWQPSSMPGLDSHVLAHCCFVAILRDNNPLARRATLPLADLSDNKIVISSRTYDKSIAAQLRWAISRAGLRPSAVGEVAEYDQLTVSVATSSAVGVHPATVVLLNRIPGVTFRQIEDPGLQLDICAVHLASNPDDRIPDYVRLLRIAVAESMRRASNTMRENSTA
jgi:DNA-binding transcriptional LysR family regulator